MFADDTVILADSHSDLLTKLESISKWMTDNAMEINPSKCGVMRISPDITPLAPVTYNGEPIPTVEKYVYLGIEFNNTLDINLMSKYRLDKGKQTLNILTKTLSNVRVPVGYRLMLIKSILIPTIHYGSEIFGMSEVRASPLKRILDNGLKYIVKKSNFCRLRVYEEFDIKPVYVSGAVARTRGLKKWINSNGLISDLIKSQEKFKSVKSTWIKEAKRWLKVMKIDLTLTSPELLKQVSRERLARLHERDSSVIGNLANRYSINSGNPIIKAEIQKYRFKSRSKNSNANHELPNEDKNINNNHIGINGIIRLRTGTFWFTRDLARSLILPESYKHKCVCCNSDVTENLEHLMLECRRFNNIRERIFPKLSNRLQNMTEASKIKVITQLLGGEGLVPYRNTSGELPKTIEYLSRVLPMRSEVIADLKDQAR